MGPKRALLVMGAAFIPVGALFALLSWLLLVPTMGAELGYSGVVGGAFTVIVGIGCLLAGALRRAS
jgi:hypothetical protein